MNLEKRIEVAALEHLETRALNPKFVILTPYSYSELLADMGIEDSLEDLNRIEVKGIRKKLTLTIAVTTDPNASDITVC